MADGMSFAELAGDAPPPAAKPTSSTPKAVKFSDLASPEPPSSSVIGEFDQMLKDDFRFVRRAGKASGDPLLQQASQTVSATADFARSAVSHPLKTAGWSAIGLEQGAESVLEAADAGLMGIATWVNEGDFSKGYDKFTNAQEHYQKLVSAAQKINHPGTLTDPGKEEQAVQGMLNLIPESIKALGDEGQQRSDPALQAIGVSPAHAHLVSAIIGTTIQGAATLFTLNPSTVAKGFEGLKPKEVIPGKPKIKVKSSAVPSREVPSAGTKGEGIAVTDKIAASFDELAKKAPATADAIAAHVAKADAGLGELLRDRVDKAQGTKPEVIGKAAAEAGRTKPKVRVKASAVPSREVNITEYDRAEQAKEDREYVRLHSKDPPLLTPEQASSSIRSTVKEGYDAMTAKPELTPRSNIVKFPSTYQPIRGEFASKFPYPDWVKSSTDRKAYWKSLSKEEQRVRKEYYNEKVPLTPRSNRGEGLPSHTLGKDINDLHAKFDPIWKTLKTALKDGKVLDASRMLSIMHLDAREGSPLKMILGKLKQHLTDDVNIVPHGGAIESRGREFQDSMGLYDPHDHVIHLRIMEDASTPHHVVTLIHEMIHAVTSRFMQENPLHPLVLEMNDLLEVARENMGKVIEEADSRGIYLGGGAPPLSMRRPGMYLGENFDATEPRFVGGAEVPWGTMYGLTNVEELLAEAGANPQFQHLLIQSAKFRRMWDKLKDSSTKIVSKIAEMLGLKDKGATKLLDNIWHTGTKIMEAQTRGEQVAASYKEFGNVDYASRSAPLHPEDPTLYTDNGKPVKKGEVEAATRSVDKLRNLPGVKIAEAKLGVFFEDVTRLVSPESLGPEAKKTGAYLAKVVSTEMQKDTAHYHTSEVRRTFWNHNANRAREFMYTFEKGGTFADKTLQSMAEGYRNWGKEIYLQDLLNGIKYDPVDNYLYHVFEDPEGVNRYFTQKYGAKFGDPSFTKDRSFDLYEQAIKANFKPRYTNPEDIMLMRQHASDAAEMKVDLFKDLEKAGLATKVGDKEGVRRAPDDAVQWTSPNGDRYAVHPKADAVMHNYFKSFSLWSDRRSAGSAFRGLMFLKNSMVPIKLGLSAFHFTHILTIDNFTGMVRATKELASRTIGPGEWLTQMTRSGLFMDSIQNPKMGGHIMRALKGQIPDKELTSYDRQALQYMAEGGLIPTMSEQYRTNAMTNFKNAIQQHSAKALWHAPFAMLGLIQRPMFEVWIPNLKVASYLKDIEVALRTDPSLLQKPEARMMVFRKIAKSVDNRYGEMAYNTLFMNRLVKDLAVLNTLSLGWQMGIMREYGGAVIDTARVIKSPRGLREKISKGDLDRPMMVSFYTAGAAGLVGLTSWALSGKPPSGMDYIYPRTAPPDEKGESPRANTMFFTREFVSLYDHMRDQGVVGGLSEMAMNKGSGVVGLITEWGRGVNSYNEEIRDPNAEPFKRMEQTLAATWHDVEPISLASIEKQGGDLTSLGSYATPGAVESFIGLTPAPKYITDSATTSAIKSTYRKYHAGGQTSYEHAQYSEDGRKLRALYDADKLDEYSDLLDSMKEKYNLSSSSVRKLETSVRKGVDPMIKMFERLDASEKRRILDKMTDEEKEKFLPHAGKDVRLSYEEVAQ